LAVPVTTGLAAALLTRPADQNPTPDPNPN
jgi:hypothetical protein